jgi:multicomponent Na+:H+ antiporter subunit F
MTQPQTFTPVESIAYWSAQAVHFLTSTGIIILSAAIVLCLYRIVRGPTLADRGTAIDVVGIQLVGLVILLTMRTGSLHFVDGILVLSLLAFAGTVAVALFVARPYMLNPRSDRVTAASRPDLHGATRPPAEGDGRAGEEGR